jgi:two-component system chemotaxis sensor kinase CheA
MLAAKLAADQRAGELATLAGRFEQWRKEWARVQPRARALRQPLRQRRDADAAPDMAGIAEFLDWNHDYVRALEGKVTALRRSAEQDRLLIGKLVDDLLENSKKLLMLPLATLGGLLSKLVRDLCRDQGKEAEFTFRGEEVTIDKRILEQLKDPLVHLLRNCIDHGVETPELRRLAGKPPRAAITLTVSPVNSTQVEISIADDGAGIDLEKVKAAAAKRGLAVPGTMEPLGESATLALVFEPDVSTSPMITRVSGRGLGLAIVREKVEKLGGHAAIESRRGFGTTIRMTLPLTLATFRGVLIESAQRLFVLPTAQVERVTRFTAEDVRTIEGRSALALNGRSVALVYLSAVLQLPSTARQPDSAAPALILGTGEQRVAFAVDAVLDEREVLVKRLTKPLSRIRNIAGATVLGSGEVAPILNVTDLLRSARTAVAAPRTATAATPSAAPAKRILVVEDSITSRMLLKGILESAGYEVKTAVDGIDAFTALRAERFDLVVSDVEMPRMNGFDLTARIRAERTLAQLPVVLVTALESREDRERGIDVGASAYLVKSSLDQSNLLEVLRRLA